MTIGSNREAQRPSPISRAMSGWQPARVLMAANRLDFFTAIGDGVLTAEEVAAKCSTQPRPTRTLLNACVALGFMEKKGELYSNTAEAKALLVRGKPTSIADGIAHQDDLWASWGKLAEAVKTNRAASERWSLVEEPQVHRNFIMAMHDGAVVGAPLVAETLDLAGRKQLFDAGGGPGTYSIFLVKKYPGLRAIVFDLPNTIEISKEVIAKYGVTDRITTQAGNYFKDDFGQGNDVVLLSAILHSMSPERSKILLKKAYDSLVPGGLVVVREGLLDDEGTSPVGAVLFSLNMLVNTGEGQSYSGKEIMELMQSVGFKDTKVIPLPPGARGSLVVGVK
ncbi:MAG TPA: methyltransferase [Dehalococcoidales bacterium]